MFIIFWATSEMHTNYLVFILFIFVFILKDWWEKLLSSHCKLAKMTLFYEYGLGLGDAKEGESIYHINSLKPFQICFGIWEKTVQAKLPSPMTFPPTNWRKAILIQILRPLSFSSEIHLHIIDMIMYPVLVASQPWARPNCSWTLSIKP